MTRFRTIFSQRERGFTLVELLTALMLIGILLSLGVFALRNYWMRQSVVGGASELVSGMRGAQELAVTESQPLVFGVRLEVGSSEWDLVRYNPTPPESCKVERPSTFPSGLVVSAASFVEASGITATCRSQIPGAAGDQFVFFFPRGTATAGTVTLRQPAINRSVSLSILPMTGRVEEI